MARIRIKDGKKLIVVLVCLIFTSGIVFVGLPKIFEREEALIEVVKVKDQIEANIQITSEMLTKVEVGKYNLPGNVITDTKEIVGKYSKATLFPSDNLVSEKFMELRDNKDNFLYNLEDDKVCIAVTVPTLAAALSGKVQEGDVVKIYVYKKEAREGDQTLEKTGTETIIDFPELSYVEVVGITNSKTEDIKEVTETLEKEKELNIKSYSNHNNIPSTIIFKCYPEQAKKLVEAENLGIIHIAFVTRDVAKKESLILEQKKLLDIKASPVANMKNTDSAETIGSTGSVDPGETTHTTGTITPSIINEPVNNALNNNTNSGNVDHGFGLD